MVKEVHAYVEVPILEGVDLTIERKRIKVKGPLGELEKDFSYAKTIDIRKEGNKVIIEAFFLRKRERALINMIASKIKNMMIGVSKGFRYKMYIVYAHFPMNIKIEGSTIIIENFLGSKDKRCAKIVGKDTKVKVSKDEVIIEGIDLEAVGQTAANIYLATRLRGKRKLCPHGRAGGPGVLDGIYFYAKEHIRE
ncbi:MAG: 50S ribosomal protein L6 [Thermoprotei archaeon]|nr:MAG: 50S ribosomal protein L6 [Thermoprotei archaeon]RLF02876.1 MAG: 50S ribosomal protein L6 [Thermoprotei archaeon]